MIRKVLLVLMSLLCLSSAWAAQTLRALPDRPQAPDFTLKDLSGKSHSLSDYRGKVVLVNFWATWCPPCRKELPSMQRAWEQLRKDNVELLAIDVGEDEETVFVFTGEMSVEPGFPILLDTEGKVSSAWPVRGLPTTFVVDRKGRIAYSAVGGREWDDPELLEPVGRLNEGDE
jgi:peroxiredoxin